jgi:aminoglycoside phosphotransferase (APT) family kinase protein
MKPIITPSLVKTLISEQFPEWSHLVIQPVALSGWDNRTFHLGKDLLVRLPSAEGYATQPEKEQCWLPQLAPHLSLKIPEPLAMGKPSEIYLWHWSIYRWIEGSSVNTLVLNGAELENTARALANFLNELHRIESLHGPLPGEHNYYRGAHPSVYDAETRATITQLHPIIDEEAVMALWEKAIASSWDKSPVWIHGDFASGNILMKQDKVVAVIDFGCMGIGDPACDLVIAWTLFKNDSRALFKSLLNLDDNTWARARGWALWKACLELKKCNNMESVEAIKQRQIIADLLRE